MNLKEQLNQAAHERAGSAVAAALSTRTAAAADRMREFRKWREERWLTSDECSDHPDFLRVRDVITAAIRETDAKGGWRVVADFGDHQKKLEDRNDNPTIASTHNCYDKRSYVHIPSDSDFAHVRNLVMLVDLQRHFRREGLTADAMHLKWTGHENKKVDFDPLIVLRTHLDGTNAVRSGSLDHFDSTLVFHPALLIAWK